MPRKVFIFLFIILLIYFGAAQSQRLIQKDQKIYFADEIIDKIQNGLDVSCKEAKIIGDLELSGQNLPKDNESRRIVNSSINIIDSDIEGNIDLGNTLFKKPLKFDGTVFSGQTVNLRRCKFDADVSFAGTTFRCPVHFDGAIINGGLYFTGTSWLGKASFESTRCDGDASFRDSDFRKGLNFKYAEITGPASFEDSSFDGETSFDNSTFQDEVSFLGARFADLMESKGAKFNRSAIFTRSRFHAIADFSDTHFKDNTVFFYASFANSAKFSQAVFEGRTDFRKCGFDGFADLSSARFVDISRFEEAQFNRVVRFANSSFTKNVLFCETYFDRDARFDGARFASTIDLTNATFSKLGLPWEAIRGQVIYDKATQLSLINNYKNLGWTQDYKSCYYNYRDEKRIEEPLGYAKALDTISWMYWGYGTELRLPIAWIFSFILIFAIIYWYLVRSGWGKAIKKDSKSGCESCPWMRTGENAKSALSFREAFEYSARALLPMEKSDKFTIEYAHIGKIVWIEIAIFGFLAAIYVNHLLGEVQLQLKPP